MCGAEVPFKRSQSLSDDHTPTIPVIADAISQLDNQGDQFDFACCIYATAPFVAPNDLQKGFEKISADPAAEFLFPVTTYPFPISRALSVEANRVKMIWPEHELTRSQDLADAYHDAGQFYWGKVDAWLTQTGMYSSESIPLIIPRHRAQDIDTLEDWALAEMMYSAMTKENA